MKLDEVLKQIKKHQWWSESAPGVIQFCLYPLYAHLEHSRYFNPAYPTIGIFIFQNDFFYEEIPVDEKYEVYNYVFKQCHKDPDYLIKKGQAAHSAAKKFRETFQSFAKNKNKLNNHDLWQSYHQFIEEYLDFVRYGAAWECVDPFTDYHLENLVKKELPKISSQERHNFISTLAAPLILSFMEKERILRLEITLNINKEKNLEDLEKNYFFTQSSFKTIKMFGKKDFMSQIEKEFVHKTKQEIKDELNGLKNKIIRLKKAKNELVKKYSLSRDLKLHFKLLEIFGRLIDERKILMLLANYGINEHLKEIGQRTNLDLQDIKQYFVRDIKKLLLKNKKVSQKDLQKRQKSSAFVLIKKGHSVLTNEFYGKDAAKILKTIMDTFKQTEIKGLVANAPQAKIKGKVQVILDAHEEKFIPGNILITTMTRPDFVPLIRQASAIVTDEGGITCHAAIISRELGIPCIIGTKVATKLLKSGDVVELDLERGVVKKI